MKEISKIDTNSFLSTQLFLHDLNFEKAKDLYKIAPPAKVDNRTIFDIMAPAIFMSRMFHLVPLTFYSDSRTAKLKIISLPFLSCIMFAVVQAFLLNVVQGSVKEFFEIILHGTELYTFTYQTMAVFAVTLCVCLLGLIRAKEFEKGWNSLLQLEEEMQITETQQMAEYAKQTKYLWGMIIHTAVFSIGYFLYGGFLLVQLCRKTEICTAHPIITAMCLISNTIAVVIMLVFGILFSSVCNIIRPFFLQIREEMALLFKDPPFYSKCLTHQSVERYRVLHARLCECVGYFEGFLGLQALLLLCSSCFTITMGIYSNIHYFNIVTELQVIRVVTLWILQAWACLVTMGHILVSAEFLTDSARCTTRVLNRVHHVNIDPRISKQVLLFNIKLGHFPLKISAFHITTISASFLATAITNIVTYVLVLFQFNLTNEDEQDIANKTLSLSTKT